MSNLPTPITDFILKLTDDTRSPAYLLVQDNGSLTEWGGNLPIYGIRDLEKERPAGEQVYFLEGLLPLEVSPTFLPYVKTDSGLYADIYLLRADEGTWVLFLDATFDARKRKAIQQKANDLSLYVVEQQREGEVLQQAKDELEELVERRTNALAKANFQLKLELEERQRVEDALRASESKFRRVAESNMIGIIFWDLNGTVTDANDAFLEMLGYTREDLDEGRIKWDEITRPELRHLDTLAIQEMKETGASVPFEKQFIRKDGTRLPLLFGAALLEGSKHQTVCFALDLSKYK
ncbi:MAG: PAS domain-containing protein [Acidobacteria bacterium]|nr:PAS domain-containing protein [Acidobacteriota bacterium]